VEWNIGRLHNTTGIAIGAALSLELLIEVFFITVFTF
jgi:hypothetical protein